MALDLEKLRAEMASPEFQAKMEAWAEKIRRRDNRIEKAHNIIQSKGGTFLDQVIEREISKYTDEYRNKCYRRGYEPYPTHVTSLLFSVAERYYDSKLDEPLDEFDEHFGGGTVNYMGYQFNWIHGQGTVIRIFKDGQEILSI